MVFIKCKWEMCVSVVCDSLGGSLRGMVFFCLDFSESSFIKVTLWRREPECPGKFSRLHKESWPPSMLGTNEFSCLLLACKVSMSANLMLGLSWNKVYIYV